MNTIKCGNINTRRFCDMEVSEFGVVIQGLRIGEMVFKTSDAIIFLSDGRTLSRFNGEYLHGIVELRKEMEVCNE